MVHDLEFGILFSGDWVFLSLIVFFCVGVQSPLFERIKDHQHNRFHFLILRDTMSRGSAKEVVLSVDGVLRLQVKFVFPVLIVQGRKSLRRLVVVVFYPSR